MGLIPYELLVPLGQLKALNLSGNHLVNVSMQIIHPVNGLEVCRQLEVFRFIFSLYFTLNPSWAGARRFIDFFISRNHLYVWQALDLSRNQLNGIADNQVALLRKIADVHLENNPLICDRCHMGALIQIAKSVSDLPQCIPLHLIFPLPDAEYPTATVIKLPFSQSAYNSLYAVPQLMSIPFVTVTLAFASCMLPTGIPAWRSNIGFACQLIGTLYIDGAIAWRRSRCRQHIA